MEFEKRYEYPKLFEVLVPSKKENNVEAFNAESSFDILWAEFTQRYIAEEKIHHESLLGISKKTDAGFIVKKIDVSKALTGVTGLIQFLFGLTFNNLVAVGAGFISCLLAFKGITTSLTPNCALIIGIIHSLSVKEDPYNIRKKSIDIKVLQERFVKEISTISTHSIPAIAFEIGLSELSSLGIIEVNEMEKVVMLKEYIYTK